MKDSRQTRLLVPAGFLALVLLIYLGVLSHTRSTHTTSILPALCTPSPRRETTSKPPRHHYRPGRAGLWCPTIPFTR